MKRDRQHEQSPASLKKQLSEWDGAPINARPQPIATIVRPTSWAQPAAALGQCPICRQLLITKCARTRAACACRSRPCYTRGASLLAHHVLLTPLTHALPPRHGMHRPLRGHRERNSMLTRVWLVRLRFPQALHSSVGHAARHVPDPRDWLGTNHASARACTHRRRRPCRCRGTSTGRGTGSGVAAVAPALTGCTFMRTSPRQSSVCAVQFEAARDRQVRAAVGPLHRGRPAAETCGQEACDSSVIRKLRLRCNPGSTALGDRKRHCVMSRV